MKVIIATSAPEKAKQLLLEGAVSREKFSIAVDPIASCDNVKMAMELAVQMCDADKTLGENGEYGLIAAEFSTDPKGNGEIMYDIIQCMPISAARQIIENRREFERNRMHGRGGRLGGPGPRGKF